MKTKFVTFFKLLLMLVLLLFVAEGCVLSGSMYVREPPPTVRVEERSEPPHPRAIWVPGYWRWAGGGYAWVPGHWEAKPRGAEWVPGYWRETPHGYHWVKGHWR